MEISFLVTTTRVTKFKLKTKNCICKLIDYNES